ncbi:MAG: DUF1326 domain-containing protein [Xanthomonadales bacterium]|nr:DUF1326 domain-containing protein [Xanthomonadales bacterium]NIX14063.1 DUF1326 domain-containing protein [Xanthomonadales bacterium]
MGYKLQGYMLEACTCNAICPCWVGEDPDGGTCHGTIAWHFEKGEIDGIDVSGLTYAILLYIPDNALAGNWRVVAFVDDAASAEQEEAILSAYMGEKGGPLADMAQLVGEVVAKERAPITFDVFMGKGELKIGNNLDAEISPFEGPTGRRTSLHDAAFSVIEESPYYVGKASHLNATHAGLDLNLRIQGKSAVQGPFAFEA